MEKAELQIPLSRVNAKLLFDQNISFRITRKILIEFPGSKHVSDVGLAGAGKACNPIIPFLPPKY